jgi:hypothetical protein
VVARDDQHVHRGLRINVTKCDSSRTLQHPVRGYLTCSNAAEKAICHATDLNVCRAAATADIYGCSTANLGAPPRWCTARQDPAPRGPGALPAAVAAMRTLGLGGKRSPRLIRMPAEPEKLT